MYRMRKGPSDGRVGPDARLRSKAKLGRMGFGARFSSWRNSDFGWRSASSAAVIGLK
jgi:hypothetical protein